VVSILDESRKAGLSPARLQLLEAVIVADRASSHKEDGDYAAAERDYRNAIGMGNEDCLPCFGDVLILEKKYEDAIPVFSKVLASNPADTDSLVSRGRAYMEAGKFREGDAAHTPEGRTASPPVPPPN
jgi:tetratricopeptide (TPR) repeat protein